MSNLEDHGLPLVSLKEHRRELVVSLLGRTGPLSQSTIQDLAMIQSAISAIESVIADLDEEQTGFYGVFHQGLHIAN